MISVVSKSYVRGVCETLEISSLAAHFFEAQKNASSAAADQIEQESESLVQVSFCPNGSIMLFDSRKKI